MEYKPLRTLPRLRFDLPPPRPPVDSFSARAFMSLCISLTKPVALAICLPELVGFEHGNVQTGGSANCAFLRFRIWGGLETEVGQVLSRTSGAAWAYSFIFYSHAESLRGPLVTLSWIGGLLKFERLDIGHHPPHPNHHFEEAVPPFDGPCLVDSVQAAGKDELAGVAAELSPTLTHFELVADRSGLFILAERNAVRVVLVCSPGRGFCTRLLFLGSRGRPCESVSMSRLGTEDFRFWAPCRGQIVFEAQSAQEISGRVAIAEP